MKNTVKKITIIVMVMTMLIGTFVLSGCDNTSLENYKAIKSQALQEYADAKGQDNYCETDWEAICKAVTDGKKAIENAAAKPAVITAFNNAIKVIDKVGEEDAMGAFYTLQEAYDEGLLTVENLQSIANHFNNDTLPADTLSSTVESLIKETAAENMRSDDLSPVVDAKADDFLILKYFGTYNGIVAVIINDPYSEPPTIIVDFWFDIAGVSFNQRGHNPITIYK